MSVVVSEVEGSEGTGRQIVIATAQSTTSPDYAVRHTVMSEDPKHCTHVHDLIISKTTSKNGTLEGVQWFLAPCTDKSCPSEVLFENKMHDVASSKPLWAMLNISRAHDTDIFPQLRAAIPREDTIIASAVSSSQNSDDRPFIEGKWHLLTEGDTPSRVTPTRFYLYAVDAYPMSPKSFGDSPVSPDDAREAVQAHTLAQQMEGSGLTYSNETPVSPILTVESEAPSPTSPSQPRFSLSLHRSKNSDNSGRLSPIRSMFSSDETRGGEPSDKDGSILRRFSFKRSKPKEPEKNILGALGEIAHTTFDHTMAIPTMTIARGGGRAPGAHELPEAEAMPVISVTDGDDKGDIPELPADPNTFGRAELE